MKHPLIRLTGLMDWALIEHHFTGHFTSGRGRPALPARLVAGLLYLQHAREAPRLATQLGRILMQKTKDKHKLYALHAHSKGQSDCIAYSVKQLFRMDYHNVLAHLNAE